VESLAEQHPLVQPRPSVVPLVVQDPLSSKLKFRR